MSRRITDSTPPLDFSDRISDLTQVFVGREWLLREVEDFIAQDKERYLIITGEPGIGKSAVAARLTQVRDVHAFHLCQARSGGTLDPVEFARSLSHQLVRSLPDFGRHVVEQKPVHIDVHIDVEQMQDGAIYGVYIDKFIVQTKSADEAFQYLVREPLKAWATSCRPDGPVLLLVDALDEALRLDRHPNIVDLIDAARDLPDIVRWVLTSRPGEHLVVLPAVRIVMLDDSAENMVDAGAYVDAILGEPQVAAALQSQRADTATLRDELIHRSGGNFLYLHYVLDSVRQDVAAERPVVAPEQLPVGLDGVYHEFLDRLLARKPKDEWRQVYRPVLGVLAVAQDTLDFHQLVALSDASPQGVNDVVTELDQLLDIAPGETKTDHRIYHTSFADFLSDRARNRAYWTDPQHHHCQITSYYIENYTGRWSDCDLYGLRYLPYHLIGAELWDILEYVLTDLKFIEAKCAGEMAYDLVSDYQIAKASIPPSTNLRNQREQVFRFAEIFERHVSQLLDQDETVFQLFWNTEAEGHFAKHVESWVTAGIGPKAPWVRRLNRPVDRGETAVIADLPCASWVNALVSIEGGRLLLVGDDSGQLGLFNVETGRRLETQNVDGPIQAIAVALNNQWVATISSGSDLHLWSLPTLQLLNTRRISGSCNSIAISAADGSIWIAASESGVSVVDSAGNLANLGGHSPMGAHDIACSVDGRWAASVGWGDDGQLVVWDVVSRTPRAKLSWLLIPSARV